MPPSGGEMVSRTEGHSDDSLIGGNASAEGPSGEGMESTVITGVYIIMIIICRQSPSQKKAIRSASNIT